MVKNFVFKCWNSNIDCNYVESIYQSQSLRLCTTSKVMLYKKECSQGLGNLSHKLSKLCVFRIYDWSDSDTFIIGQHFGPSEDFYGQLSLQLIFVLSAESITYWKKNYFKKFLIHNDKTTGYLKDFFWYKLTNFNEISAIPVFSQFAIICTLYNYIFMQLIFCANAMEI